MLKFIFFKFRIHKFYITEQFLSQKYISTIIIWRNPKIGTKRSAFPICINLYVNVIVEIIF